MCIRDRPYLSTKVLVVLNQSCIVHDASVVLNGRPFGLVGCDFPINTCLLYTSDAADERSSVDLGGRRIFKKKKQNTIRESSHVYVYITSQKQKYILQDTYQEDTT